MNNDLRQEGLQDNNNNKFMIIYTPSLTHNSAGIQMTSRDPFGFFGCRQQMASQAVEVSNLLSVSAV